MSAKQRHRFAWKWTRCIAATGMLTAAACGAATEDEPQTPQEQIARDLDRLDALDVLDVGEMPPDVDAELQAARLTAFADVAERAVRDVDSGDISEDWQTEAGEPTLCIRAGDGAFCLTHELHNDNLRRVNALEIVPVTDIVRSDSEVTGFCYSSWETVTEDECVRGLKLEAIADLAEREID